MFYGSSLFFFFPFFSSFYFGESGNSGDDGWMDGILSPEEGEDLPERGVGGVYFLL